MKLNLYIKTRKKNQIGRENRDKTPKLSAMIKHKLRIRTNEMKKSDSTFQQLMSRVD